MNDRNCKESPALKNENMTLKAVSSNFSIKKSCSFFPCSGKRNFEKESAGCREATVRDDNRRES